MTLKFLQALEGVCILLRRDWSPAWPSEWQSPLGCPRQRAVELWSVESGPCSPSQVLHRSHVLLESSPSPQIPKPQASGSSLTVGHLFGKMWWLFLSHFPSLHLGFLMCEPRVVPECLLAPSHAEGEISTMGTEGTGAPAYRGQW